jgi:hypothetical protein
MSDITITPGQETAEPAKPRKRKRVFMWFFLAVNALFALWVFPALFSGTGASHAEIASMCGNGAWSPLFKSYQDCVVHGAHGIIAAHDVGKTVALTMMIGLWVAADVILGIGRLVVVFARRNKG